MRYLTFIAFLLLSFSGYGQRYKDVFPQIANASSDEEALSLIKTYMIEDLDHPNSNLRLALIYERRYLNSDPLTQYERAMANANESALRFIKASAVVTEKDVSKNPGWYANFSNSFDNKGRPVVVFATVDQKIKHGYDSAKLFTEKMPAIYQAFTESVDFYDQAIKLFAQINGQYTSLDRLLLQYNDSLDQKLETLKTKYDSSLHYLDKYIELINKYPIHGYDQTYTVNPIKTYRLEGLLTSPNFLVDNIEIWNYKQWASDVQESVSAEVSTLRTSLEEAENKLSNSLGHIMAKSYNEKFEPYRITKKLEFELRKFDNESLPVALLKYKEFKQELLLKHNITSSFDSTQNVDIKNAYYGEVIYHSQDADSLLSIVQNRIDAESMKEYPDYLSKHYGNEKALNEFVTKEKTTAKTYLESSVENLRKNLLGQVTMSNETEYYSYGRLRIPSAIENDVDPDSLDNSFHTTHKVKSADGSQYIAGIVKSSRGSNPVLTYIIKVNDDGHVVWYNQYEMVEDAQGNQFNILGDIILTPEGCALAIHSYDEQSKVNNLVYLDEDGKELFTKQLDTQQFPRLGQYLEHNSSLLLTYKGKTLDADLKTEEALEMLNINLIGDLLWTKTFDYAGDLQSLVPTSEGYMIVGNYSAIKNTKGQKEVTKINSNQTNGFVVKFTHQGLVNRVVTLKSDELYVINKVIKVNDSLINLLGYRHPSGQVIHFILNQEGSVVYSNL